MITDPAPYIIFAGLLGAAIGFFGCGIFASNKIRRANFEGYKEGLDAGKRAMAEMIDATLARPAVRITPDGRAHYSPPTERGIHSASSH